MLIDDADGTKLPKDERGLAQAAEASGRPMDTGGDDQPQDLPAGQQEQLPKLHVPLAQPEQQDQRTRPEGSRRAQSKSRAADDPSRLPLEPGEDSGPRLKLPRNLNPEIAYFLGSMEDLGASIQGQIITVFQKLEEEMFRQIADVNLVRQLEHDMMKKEIAALEEKIHDMEAARRLDHREILRGHLDTYHRMQALDERQTLRHDMAYATFFRHVEGNDGLIEKWSARLSRIEAKLGLPIGTIDEYRPVKNDADSELVNTAAQRAIILSEEAQVAIDRMQAELDGELPAATIDEVPAATMEELPDDGLSTVLGNAMFGGEPGSPGAYGEPEAGPSRFPGNYQTPPPQGDVAQEIDHGSSERADHASSDIEFVTGIVPSPSKPMEEAPSSDSIEFVETAGPVDDDVTMPDIPDVKVTAPTPQNSQPEVNAIQPAQPPIPPARVVPASREAARLMMAGWGATTDYLAPGPPAARTRGRSRANSAEQPPADVQRVRGRYASSAEPPPDRRSRSPAARVAKGK